MPDSIVCQDCGILVAKGPRCHTCAAEHRYRVSEIDDQMFRMHQEGHSLSAIAERFGVSKARAGQRVARARGRGFQ